MMTPQMLSNILHPQFKFRIILLLLPQPPGIDEDDDGDYSYVMETYSVGQYRGRVVCR